MKLTIEGEARLTSVEELLQTEAGTQSVLPGWVIFTMPNRHQIAFSLPHFTELAPMAKYDWVSRTFSEPSDFDVEQELVQGNIEDVLARVGDDTVLADRALTIEKGSSSPRKGLIEKLERLLAAS